jgi:PAS domain S-box-containing protein
MGVSLTSEKARSEAAGPQAGGSSLALVAELVSLLLQATPDDVPTAISRAVQRLLDGAVIDGCAVIPFDPKTGPTGKADSPPWPATFATAGMPDKLGMDIGSEWAAQLAQAARIEPDLSAALPGAAQAGAGLAEWGRLSVTGLRPAGRLSGLVIWAWRHTGRVAPDVDELLGAVGAAIGSALQRLLPQMSDPSSDKMSSDGYNRLRTTLGALPDLVVEVDALGRHQAVYTGDPGQMMVAPDDLLGKTHEEAMPPDIAALNRRAMTEVDATGHSGPHLFWAETPRGRRRYAMTASPRPPFQPGGRPGYVFVARDVTREWRLAAEAERLGLIARRMTDLVLIIGIDDRIEWVNPAFERRTGWTLAEVRGRKPSEVLHAPETDLAEVARIKAQMDAGQPARSVLLNRTRDGEEFWTRIDLQPLRDVEGILTGYVSIETDITEQKQQAEALEQFARQATEARDRLAMAVEALPDAFAYFDAEDRLVLWNTKYAMTFPALQSILRPGVRFEEILRGLAASGTVPELIGREDTWLAERLAHHREASSVRDETLGNMWHRIIERVTPDGGRVGMRIDITELKDAEQRLADIIDGAEAGTWEWDFASGSNLINARWAEIVGYTLEELAPLTIDVWRRLLHPDDLKAAEQKLAKIFSGEQTSIEYELRMRHKAGHWVWVMSRGRIVRSADDGTPLVMAGVHIDITALKRAEQRLEEIIDAAAAGTWELDIQTGAKRINDRWAEMLGYTRAELFERPQFGFRQMIHPDDLVYLLDQEKTMLSGGVDRFANEIRMRHKDGHWVWVLSRGQVTARDADGRPRKLAGIHLDITERMRLQTQLTAERDYLARLMDTSVSGITALDRDGRIIFANRGAERILGLKASETTGLPYNAPTWEIRTLGGAPFPDAELPFARVMAEDRVVRDVRFSIAWPDGGRRMLSVNAAPIHAEGLSVRVVCSINDITDQVAAENDLRDAAERAEAANRAKSLFLANMSHEIRTPLNGVLGMAQLLEAELTQENHLHMLSMIRASGETLLGVLNDVLDMSKIEAGKLTLEVVPFSPADLARQVEAMHSVLAREKGLDFTLILHPDAALPRMGDPGRIAQILHNLVSNAVKFTEQGRVSVSIDIRDDTFLDIRVTDTGIGMTEEQLSRVFEEFEQADGTVTRRFGGTGLGMSIVRRLVVLMQGDIRIDSTPGGGTTALIKLPLPKSLGAIPIDDIPSDRLLSGLRVLAADDNRTNRTILGTLLDRLGMKATLTEDGRAALNAWEADKFDLYLLDISMPELDGIAALAAIRAAEAACGAKPVPAIAITANVMSHQVESYRAAGFSGFVAKPFRRDDLVVTMLRALGAISG